jgi:hypothetical protein
MATKMKTKLMIKKDKYYILKRVSRPKYYIKMRYLDLKFDEEYFYKPVFGWFLEKINGYNF